MIESLDPNISVIIIGLVVILSYAFNVISLRTHIPSVVLLILLGVGMDRGFEWLWGTSPNVLPVLQILGIVGLVMIVLEAALDLELNREKKGMILKSLGVALGALIATASLIGVLLYYFFIDDPFVALVYSLPLAIVSSAVLIPSVQNLPEEKREFLIYEATFSDILGIMFFYFLIGYHGTTGLGSIAAGIGLNILLTVGLALLLSYALTLFFQAIRTRLKFFLLFSVLMVLYAAGKLLHLSALLIILVFGLVINNPYLFFRGSLKRLIKPDILRNMLDDLKLVTLEATFMVRTFFFVLFGMVISLSELLDSEVALIGLVIGGIIYGLRYGFLRGVVGRDITPEVYLAPRGLITILLFYAIPSHLKVDFFYPGILLYTIVLTSVVMTVALVKGKASPKIGEDLISFHMASKKEVEEEEERSDAG